MKNEEDMNSFWKCFFYLIATGIVAFFVGRALPKKWFRADLFPYRSYAFEKEGRIYDKLKIRYWQNRVPDMSKILPKWMPPKRLEGNYRECLPRMLQETCVAELIHVLLCVSGLYCLKLYPGAGGIIIVMLYILFLNLPFVIIQRYNRPRLMRIMERIDDQEKTEEKWMVCEY